MYGRNFWWSFGTSAPKWLEATPRPNIGARIAISPDGIRRLEGVLNCSSCPPEQPHISIQGSTMEIVDARAISVLAVNPRDAQI